MEDPRIERCKRYGLLEILFLSVCAVLSGAEGWEAIESCGHIKLAWLRKVVPLDNGIPRHDTIARVLSRWDPEGLQRAFVAWMQAVSEVTAGEIVAIDGKPVLSWSKGRCGGLLIGASRKNALHRVSAWAGRHGVVLGQVKTEAKSNAMTAIPVLLDLLEITGCMVTLNAMGCQRAIAQRIQEKKADYVFAVKDNQGVLHEEIVAFFETARAHDFRHCPHEYHEDTDAGHGRVEVRRYWQSTHPSTSSGQVWIA